MISTLCLGLGGRCGDYFDLAFLVRNLNSHGIISAFEKYIYRTRAAAKTLNPQLRDALWQVRTIKQNPVAGPLNGSSQTSLNQ